MLALSKSRLVRPVWEWMTKETSVVVLDGSIVFDITADSSDL